MRINVSGHHVEVTDPLREYVTSKMGKLERHFDHITNIDVTLIVEKMVQKAEASVHVSGADLFANAENENMYAAIDGLADKLDRQIIKHKEKIQGKTKRNHQRPDIEAANPE
ncbi:MAG: ribosome-associated translation inhibitor RaiA [Gammaproteobacteria bacterium]|nr:ribosome-associated translation inhibitor RaiA [Gammaproteobacteria bacterium]NND40384.1 ribosome-associated translation inhibitor RaiA [Pseudomonadales bacterium]MBT8149839.1 ribosome-associated translation inhibitor RaiA [Gammaproteobacteria bacterium]NNL10402.1 ribosome-associated translation inhibitor RaiA [Pseudomonadales bacterium]NNM12553.1 ribosome-associated translation inhibitor RaiA [Pseudomonadales bacterium]